MPETLIAESERWSHEVEKEWEKGTVNACEADTLEQSLDRSLSRNATGKILDVEIVDAEEHRSQPAAKRNYHRRSQRIRTSADARAADRLPDDQWMLR